MDVSESFSLLQALEAACSGDLLHELEDSHLSYRDVLGRLG